MRLQRKLENVQHAPEQVNTAISGLSLSLAIYSHSKSSIKGEESWGLSTNSPIGSGCSPVTYYLPSSLDGVHWEGLHEDSCRYLIKGFQCAEVWGVLSRKEVRYEQHSVKGVILITLYVCPLSGLAVNWKEKLLGEKMLNSLAFRYVYIHKATSAHTSKLCQ